MKQRRHSRNQSSRIENVDDIRRNALIFAGVSGTLVWTGLLGRLAQLQLFESSDLQQAADNNAINFEAAPPRRGQVFDRFGEPLATHRNSWSVYAKREDLDDVEGTLRRIAENVEMSDASIARVLRAFARERRFLNVPILEDLTYEQFARLSVDRHHLPGVTIEATQARSYPRGRDFAHVVGYVARPNQRDIERTMEERGVDPRSEQANGIRRQLKHPAMRVGRLGLERYADEWLKGEFGELAYEKNAQGRTLGRITERDKPPVPGQDIWLTVDAGLQRSIIERFGDETGAAVVLDLESGDILALASKPTYNPNDFVNGISSSDYNALRTDERSPLYHKAYDGVYPPGSTFKMVVGSAALRHGVITPEERVVCNGRYPFGNRTFHCWKREGHGPVNLHEALKVSCDTYFYEVSRRLGPEKISEEAKAFGLGIDYHLGITGGAAGVVPNDAWKRAQLNEPWYDGETLNYGIGQGYLTTSPLQLAVMTARFALGGSRMIQPRLVGQGPEVPSNPIIGDMPTADIIERLKAGMFGVTSEPRGTALRSGDLGLGGVRMAGKTGTAQVRYISAAERASGVIKNDDLPRRLRDHALFVGYAPHDAPKYAVAVVVEHGGSGSSDAAPVAKDVLREALVRNSGRSPRFQFAATPVTEDQG